MRDPNPSKHDGDGGMCVRSTYRGSVGLVDAAGALTGALGTGAAVAGGGAAGTRGQQMTDERRSGRWRSDNIRAVLLAGAGHDDWIR